MLANGLALDLRLPHCDRIKCVPFCTEPFSRCLRYVSDQPLLRRKLGEEKWRLRKARSLHTSLFVHATRVLNQFATPERRFLRGVRSSPQRCPQIVVRRKMLFHKKKGTHGTPFFTCTIYESSTDLNLVSVHELFEHTQDVSNLIARRAFEIFESRGHVHGNDREDWFLAESELLTPVKFHLSESGEQLMARAEVPGFNREEIKVSVEPRRLSISGKAEPHEDHPSGKHAHSLRHAQLMFRVIDLPTEVDLSKAKATFHDGTLEVLMPKAAPAKSVRVETKPELSAESDTSVPEMVGSKPQAPRRL